MVRLNVKYVPQREIYCLLNKILERECILIGFIEYWSCPDELNSSIYILNIEISQSMY